MIIKASALFARVAIVRRRRVRVVEDRLKELAFWRVPPDIRSTIGLLRALVLH